MATDSSKGGRDLQTGLKIIDKSLSVVNRFLHTDESPTEASTVSTPPLINTGKDESPPPGSLRFVIHDAHLFSCLHLDLRYRSFNPNK